MSDIAPHYLKAWVTFDLPLRFRMRGESMRSSFPPGVSLVVRGVAADCVSAGDALVYSDAGTVICHRVVRRRRTRHAGWTFFAAGDSSPAGGAWVAEHDVIGKVVAVDRGGLVTGTDTWWQRTRGLAAAIRALTLTHAFAALSRIKRLRHRRLANGAPAL